MTATLAADLVAEARGASLAANRAYRDHVMTCAEECSRGRMCPDARRLDLDAGAADWALQRARELASR